MVAEENSRRKGIAGEAVMLKSAYADPVGCWWKLLLASLPSRLS
jgi:hypothetical protein